MTFKLERKSANRAVVKYHITDGKGTIYGSVNVPRRGIRFAKMLAGARRSCSYCRQPRSRGQRDFKRFAEKPAVKQAGDFARLLR
jgi:hypothetical protein